MISVNISHVFKNGGRSKANIQNKRYLICKLECLRCTSQLLCFQGKTKIQLKPWIEIVYALTVSTFHGHLEEKTKTNIVSFSLVMTNESVEINRFPRFPFTYTSIRKIGKTLLFIFIN